MKTAIYSSHLFEKEHLLSANNGKHELVFIEEKLNSNTIELAKGCEAVALFVNDDASAESLGKLHRMGIRFIVLRSAGYNHVNISATHQLGIGVARVPAYSPYAVAEHAIALMLALNRKLVVANARVRDLNFLLNGLAGFDMYGKTVGIVGTGKIGSVAARILHGFGCNILAFDKNEDKTLREKYNIKYTDFNTLCAQSDVITLHVPLTSETKYLVNKECIETMKPGVMLINTARGALINTADAIAALKTGRIGYLGIDVYEEEEPLFFEDHSGEILYDEMLARLMTFKNVLITGHQAFLTAEALKNIAATTIYNLDCFEKKIKNENVLPIM